MPSSSNFFTRLASEYLGGGCVKCCSSINDSILIGPLLILGKIFSSSSLFWFWKTFKNPSNFNTEPLVLQTVLLSSDVTVIVLRSNFAVSICEDRALLHIRLYSFCWSGLKYFLTESGVLIISVGLIASWASWAFLAFFPE